jgi:type II secretory pathway component GspD/PulD (secretin)
MKQNKSDYFCFIWIGVGIFLLVFLGKIKAEEIIKEENSAQQKFSFDLKGVDVGKFLKTLSLKTGYTIIPTKSVRGTITIFLNNVTWQEALDLVCLMQDLAYEKKDNIITVMSGSEYEKLFGKKFIERKKIKTVKLNYAKPENVFKVLNEIKSNVGKVIMDKDSATFILIDTPQNLDLMQEVINQLDQPLESIVLDLNYAKPEDVKEYVSSLITPDVGKVIIDERTNKVIVYDLPQRIKKIESLVKTFDEESRQVRIEVKIVQVALTDRNQRGVEWEKLESSWHNLDFKGSFPISSSLSSYGQVSIGTLSEDDYEFVLKFLKTQGDTQIVSQPQITVLDNQEAKILVGKREAYVTQNVSQGADTTVTSEQVNFIDVGIKLSVTPKINKEGFITMKIKPEVSEVSDTLKTQVSEVPIVGTSEAETVVKVKDGTTIMIAGLIKEEKRDDRSGTPFFSNSPLLNTRDRNITRTELIVFITPHIVGGENKNLSQRNANATF